MTKVNFDPVMENRVRILKNDRDTGIFLGKYWMYRRSVRELAKIGVDNFELVKNTQGSVIIRSVSIFNLLKIKLLNALRIKTKAEKQYGQMLREDAMRDNYKAQLRKRIENEIRYDMDRKAKPEIDKIVKEKVDKFINMIPEDELEQAANSVVMSNGNDIESNINGNIKYRRVILEQERQNFNKTVFNEQFLKDILKK